MVEEKEALFKINGQFGTFTVNDGNEAVKNASAIHFPESTVVVRIEVNNDTGTNVIDDYISTAANPLCAGTLITPLLADKFFSAITLSSGSCSMVLKEV